MGLPDPDNCKDRAKFKAALLSMNEVILCGVNELERDEADAVVKHVMDKKNWTRGGDATLVKKKPAPAGDAKAPKAEPDAPSDALGLVSDKVTVARAFIAWVFDLLQID